MPVLRQVQRTSQSYKKHNYIVFYKAYIYLVSITQIEVGPTFLFLEYIVSVHLSH